MVAHGLRTRRAVIAENNRRDQPAASTAIAQSNPKQPQQQHHISDVAAKKHKDHDKAASPTASHLHLSYATISASPRTLTVAVNTGLAGFAATLPTISHSTNRDITPSAHPAVAYTDAAPASLSSIAIYSIIAGSSILLALILSGIALYTYRRRRSVNSDLNNDIERGCLSLLSCRNRPISAKTISEFGCKDAAVTNKDTKRQATSDPDESDNTLVEQDIARDPFSNSISYPVSPYMGCGAYKIPSIPVSPPTYQVDNGYISHSQRPLSLADDPDWHPPIPERPAQIYDFSRMDLPAIIYLPEDVKMPLTRPTFAYTGDNGAPQPPMSPTPLLRPRVTHQKPNGFLAPPRPMRKPPLLKTVKQSKADLVKPVLVEGKAVKADHKKDTMFGILDSYSNETDNLADEPVVFEPLTINRALKATRADRLMTGQPEEGVGTRTTPQSAEPQVVHASLKDLKLQLESCDASDNASDSFNVLPLSASITEKTNKPEDRLPVPITRTSSSDIALANDAGIITKMVKSASVESARMTNCISIHSTTGEIEEMYAANISDDMTMVEEGPTTSCYSLTSSKSTGTMKRNSVNSRRQSKNVIKSRPQVKILDHTLLVVPKVFINHAPRHESVATFARSQSSKYGDERTLGYDDDLDPFELEDDYRMADIVERVVTPTEEVFAAADNNANSGRRRYESAKGTTFEAFKPARVRNSTAHGLLTCPAPTLGRNYSSESVAALAVSAGGGVPQTPRPEVSINYTDSPDSLLSFSVVSAFAGGDRAKSDKSQKRMAVDSRVYDPSYRSPLESVIESFK